MSGAPLPAPIHASKKLAKLIVKTCSYQMEQRPQSATELYRELSKLLNNTSNKYVIQPDVKENSETTNLQDNMPTEIVNLGLDQTVLGPDFLFQTENYPSIDSTLKLPVAVKVSDSNNKKSNLNYNRNIGREKSRHDYGNNNGVPPYTNYHDELPTQPPPNDKKHNLISWIIFTCTISLIPTILYLLCGYFIIKGKVSYLNP